MSLLSKIILKFQGASNRVITNSYKKSMRSCGKDVRINKGTIMTGTKNMSFGSHIYIGPGCTFYSTSADLTIKDYVTFGPNVTIVTGNHRTDKIGEYIYNVREKNKTDDLPVIIEEDVWVGANAVILKGVKIAKGSIIGASSVVSKDTVPYGIYGGVPAKLIKMRFSEEEIATHEKMLKEKYCK